MTWKIKHNATEKILPQEVQDWKRTSAKVIKQHPMAQQYPFIFPHGGKARVLILKGIVFDKTKTIAEIYTAWLDDLANWAEDLDPVKLTTIAGPGYTEADFWLVKFVDNPKKGIMHTVWIQMELWKVSP